jgi:cell division protein FtsW (lipid II flippase)
MDLVETINLSFIFGKIPESVGLLIFGIGLIFFTILIRRILRWAETSKEEKN